VGPRAGDRPLPCAAMSDPPVPASRRPGARVAFGATLLVALAVVLGGQLLRVALPMIGWYLRDTVELPVLGLVPYALGPFLAGFAAPLLVRILRPRGALLVAGLGLAAVRLVEQLSSSPEVKLWAALAGITLFLWLLAIAATRSRQATVLGVVLGLTMDTGLRGVTGTIDPSWAPGTWPSLVVIASVLLLALLVVAAAGPKRSLASRGTWIGLPGGHRPRVAISLVAIGPFLLLHWLILQNQGWVATQTGWDWPASLTLIIVGNAVSLAGAASALPSEHEGTVAAALGLILLAAAALATQTGAIFAVIAFIGLAASGPYLASVVGPPDPMRPGGVATTLSVATGGLLLVLLAFVYYAALDLPLPFEQSEVRTAIGVVLALLALAAADIPAGGTAPDWRPAIVGALLLAVPAAVLVLHPPPGDPERTEGFPVTVATYNLHSGWDTDGRHSLEAIADVIERSDVDVVGLQEAGRGWLMDGAHDAVGWLARRLDMPHVAFHAPGDDPLWGNAIMSRYPLDEIRTDALPRMGTPVPRGYVSARIDLGRSEFLDLFVTHLHHEAEDLTVLHEAQIEVILEAWDEAPRTVLVGDLNAEPDDPQITGLLETGFVDAWEEGGGEGPGATWPADAPEVRIDYVLHTEDLSTEHVEVIDTAASDHRPVVATIGRAD
jgi:endonuclease/exonuclease/phosphatase family metal-dependent hydrolase